MLVLRLNTKDCAVAFKPCGRLFALLTVNPLHPLEVYAVDFQLRTIKILFRCVDDNQHTASALFVYVRVNTRMVGANKLRITSTQEVFQQAYAQSVVLLHEETVQNIRDYKVISAVHIPYAKAVA